MEIDLDTFLTTVDCLIDDLYRAQFAPLKPVRPGQRPTLSDREVLTLVILAQWQPNRSERAFLRYAGRRWRPYFPALLSQSAFNRRARDVLGVLAALGPTVAAHLAAALGLAPAYAILASVPAPLARRCRGIRHHLFAEEAGIGHGGSDDEWYDGVQWLTVVDAAGLITGFAVGSAATDERWLADALLRWRRDPTATPPTAADLAPRLGPSHTPGGGRRGPSGPIAPSAGAGRPDAAPDLADLGLRGGAWRGHWRDDYQATVLTTDDYAALPPAERAAVSGWFCGLRQAIETVNGRLDDTLGLKFPRARSYWGVLTRLAAKVVAFNISVHLNHLFDRPPFASFNPLQL
jgi:hypothetical protein